MSVKSVMSVVGDRNPFTLKLREGDIDGFYEAGEELHRTLMKQERVVIKDRTYHLKKYKMCFKGDEFVSWLVDHQMASSRVEAEAIGASLLMFGIIHHVCDDHNFKDEGLFYRFRMDDDTYQGKSTEFRRCARLAVHTYALCRTTPGLIDDRDYHLSTYKTCFVARALVLWFITQGLCDTEHVAVELGLLLQKHGFIHHVTNDHEFKDAYLFFRFSFDELSMGDGTQRLFSNISGFKYLGFVDTSRILGAPKAARANAYEEIKDSSIVIKVQPPEHAYEEMRLEAKDGKVMLHSKSGVLELTEEGRYEIETPSFSRSSSTASGSSGPRAPSPPPRPSQSSGGDAALTAGYSKLKLSKDREQDCLTWMKEQPWYHGLVTREVVIDRFGKAGSPDGMWLIRESTNHPGQHVVSICSQHCVYHFNLSRWRFMSEDGVGLKWMIKPGPSFSTLRALIDHYSTVGSTELPCPMRKPCVV